ncbi:MAG: formamidopyrimidine-DNA glycosylase, partial [Planctomycetota bacterium]|nr:formamidopyrimidine-DNA glycosylase [Planctomycetota bacterium]
MPELPDILLYQHGLHHRLVGARINEIRIKSPFVLRTFDPPIDVLVGQRIAAVGRVGKRLVVSTDAAVHLVIHLMIGGRLLWKPERQVAGGGKIDLASIMTDRGTLVLTEAAKLKRASLHVLGGDLELAAHAPRGLDVLSCTLVQFAQVLTSERRTLKRALTSPGSFDGIGNAYSDEILWKARLSPLAHTTRLSSDQVSVLH